MDIVSIFFSSSHFRSPVYSTAVINSVLYFWLLSSREIIVEFIRFPKKALFHDSIAGIRSRMQQCILLLWRPPSQPFPFLFPSYLIAISVLGFYGWWWVSGIAARHSGYSTPNSSAQILHSLCHCK